MFATIVIGTFIFGFGGWAATAVVLLFFISSAVFSGHWKIDYPDLPGNARRNGLQVWSNGFWLIICLVLSVFFSTNIFMVGAMAVVATATADTWATELGISTSGTTYLVTNFQSVRPGTDGGVSLKGTTAAVTASALIAGLSIYVFSFHFYVFLCIFAAGFLGCLVDSYLGAIFQRKNRSVTIPVVKSKIGIDNNLVNGMSTGVGALLAIIFRLIIA